MQIENHISFWLGRFASTADLTKVLTTHYTSDGDFSGSTFSRAFGLGRYNDSLREARWHSSAVIAVEEFLAGVSYSETIVPTIKALLRAQELRIDTYNTFIILFDFKPPAEIPHEIIQRSWQLRFVGFAQCEYRKKRSK